MEECIFCNPVFSIFRILLFHANAIRIRWVNAPGWLPLLWSKTPNTLFLQYLLQLQSRTARNSHQPPSQRTRKIAPSKHHFTRQKTIQWAYCNKRQSPRSKYQLRGVLLPLGKLQPKRLRVAMAESRLSRAQPTYPTWDYAKRKSLPVWSAKKSSKYRMQTSTRIYTASKPIPLTASKTARKQEQPRWLQKKRKKNPCPNCPKPRHRAESPGWGKSEPSSRRKETLSSQTPLKHLRKRLKLEEWNQFQIWILWVAKCSIPKAYAFPASGLHFWGLTCPMTVQVGFRADQSKFRKMMHQRPRELVAMLRSTWKTVGQRKTEQSWTICEVLYLRFKAMQEFLFADLLHP